MIHKCATWKLCLFLLATTGFRGLAAAATDTAPATGTTETAGGKRRRGRQEADSGESSVAAGDGWIQ